MPAYPDFTPPGAPPGSFRASWADTAMMYRSAAAVALERPWNIGRAGWGDFEDSKQKSRLAAGAALALSTIGVGAARLPLIGISAATLEVLQRTDSALPTGAAAAGLFGGWSFTVARTLSYSMGHFPSALQTVKTEFAPTIDFLQHHTFPSTEATDQDSQEQKSPWLQRLGHRLHRGVHVLGIGITPYMVVAGIQGRTPSTLRRLSRGASIDCAAVAGLTAGGFAEAIVRIEQHNPQLAQHLQENLNTKTLTAAALALAGAQLATRRLQLKKYRQEHPLTTSDSALTQRP